MPQNSLIVFAKYPVPGQVKTRLAKDIGDSAAVILYSHFVSYTIRKFANSRDSNELRVAVAQESFLEKFKQNFPGADKYVAQKNTDNLGARMQHAIQQSLNEGFQKIVVIGTDCPHLPTEYVQKAFDLLDKHDIAIGPAEDGGYYLLAISQDHPCLFEGISWSTENVLKQTIAAIKKNDVSYALLPALFDIDDFESLQMLVRKYPGVIFDTNARNGQILSFLYL
jgi:rSAM/selenodomain-associated transferase 1